MAAHPRGCPPPAPARRLTREELPWLVGVSEVRGPLQHPEVRPRRVGELDEHVGHVEDLWGWRGVDAPRPPPLSSGPCTHTRSAASPCKVGSLFPRWPSGGLAYGGSPPAHSGPHRGHRDKGWEHTVSECLPSWAWRCCPPSLPQRHRGPSGSEAVGGSVGGWDGRGTSGQPVHSVRAVRLGWPRQEFIPRSLKVWWPAWAGGQMAAPAPT